MLLYNFPFIQGTLLKLLSISLSTYKPEAHVNLCESSTDSFEYVKTHQMMM